MSAFPAAIDMALPPGQRWPRRMSVSRWHRHGCRAAGVPIAAGVLYPVFGLLLSPIIAAAAMALSWGSVVGNALRLRRTSLTS